MEIKVRNVNHAYPLALALLRDEGKIVAPRGIETLEMEGVFNTVYERPWECVLMDPERDANPFFHFFEALWILAGRSDVKFLAWLLPRMAEFSDNGVTFNAPYGFRLRKSYGFDQIEACIKRLQDDSSSRQAVATIWEPGIDLFPHQKKSKDYPCNDMVMFKIRDGKLRMTVNNRSNDAIWGAYGANAVQFSVLQQYVAAKLGVKIGTYTQVSDSFHVYRDLPIWKNWVMQHPTGVPPVTEEYPEVEPMLSATNMEDFDSDLKEFFDNWDLSNRWTEKPSECGFKYILKTEFKTPFFNNVVYRLMNAFLLYREKNYVMAMHDALCAAQFQQDWGQAAAAWIHRRQLAAEAKA